MKSSGTALETLWKEFSAFDPEGFVTRTKEGIRAAIAAKGYKGVVFGASGGIDSLVSAALCVQAKKDKREWRVVGLQMIDRRVKGETYNPELFKRLGVELVIQDITPEARDTEKDLGMPPRWLTLILTKVALFFLPRPTLRRLILGIKAGSAPGQILRHFQLLIYLHRIRISRLREFADLHYLMPVICANLTEGSLGYFVEGGIDDPERGEFGPISGLYKTQVFATARYLGIPEKALIQKPSPGFGGIHDEDILGPYVIIDHVLSGISAGFSDSEIAGGLRRSPYLTHPGVSLREKTKRPRHYIGFLRSLMEVSLQKKN